MSSELVYRMRTCAAALLAAKEGGNPWDTTKLVSDTADLLVEAANLLDQPDELGSPMEILQPVKPSLTKAVQAPQGANWDTTSLPTKTFDFGAHNPRPCPSCGSVDVRKVAIEHRKLMLICPHCSHRWEFAK